MTEKKLFFQGFSLVEITVVMGVLALGALGSSQLFIALHKGQNEATIKIGSRELINSVQQILSGNDRCLENFLDIDVATLPRNFTEIRSLRYDRAAGTATPFVAYTTATNYENNTLRLDRITLGSYVPVNNTSGSIPLTIRLQKLRSKSGDDWISQKIILIVNLKSATDQKIAGCYAAGGKGEGGGSDCEELGGRLVPGPTPADNVCVFPKTLIATEPGLNNNTAFVNASGMLHIRGDSNSDSIFEDFFLSLADGRNATNYSYDGTSPQVPLPAATTNSLYVAEDQRINGAAINTGKLIASQLVIAETPYWSDANYLSPPQNVQLYIRNDFGIGATNGDMFFNGGGGGGSGYSTFANTSEDGTGGIEFVWNPNGGASPYPGGSPNRIMVMRNSGSVGIGFTLKGANPLPPMNSGTYAGINYTTPIRLFVEGGIGIQKKLQVRDEATVYNWTVPSDRRFKHHLRPLTKMMNKIFKIQGVRFEWNETYPYAPMHHRQELGFIAQEVREVFPEVVYEDEDGYLKVEYEKLLPVLWEGFKEIRREEKVMNQELQELERLMCLDHPEEDFCQKPEGIL
jgi:type II secretory pathway pseudopilin PulG